MKKTFLFYLSMAISITSISQLWLLEAKETTDSKIKFGLKAGIAFANCQVQYNPAMSPGVIGKRTKAGAAGGVFVQIPVVKNICFQPELLMIGKGMKERNQYYFYRTDLTYLELPLNILYKPASAKGSFFIGGGPAPSIFIGENIFYSGDKPFKGFDFGINLLAGYEIPLGFSINLHYTHGLQNISRDKSYITELKNRCFGIMVGYVF